MADHAPTDRAGDTPGGAATPGPESAGTARPDPRESLAPREGGRRRLDRVLAASFLDGLDRLDLAELRHRRREAEQEEADLSYVRRMLQGRTDILRAELTRRAAGEGTDGAAGAVEGDAALVQRLTQVLADQGRRSDRGSGRFLTVEPSRVDEHRRAVEQLIADVEVSDAHGSSEEELRLSLERLEGFEHAVSETRARVQAVMDALTAEVGRRYKDGAARVDDLLPDA